MSDILNKLAQAKPEEQDALVKAASAACKDNTERLALERELYRAGEVDHAAAVLADAHGAEPNNLEVFFLGGLLYHTLGDVKKAYTMYLKAVNGGYKTVSSLLQLAMLEEALGYAKDAEIHMNAARSLDRDEPVTIFTMMNLFMRQKRFSRAEDCANKIISLRPALVNGYTAKAAALTNMKKHEEAFAVLDAVKDRFATDSDFIYSYAYCQTMKGDPDGAEQYLESKKGLYDKADEKYLRLWANIYSAQERQEELLPALKRLFVVTQDIETATSIATLALAMEQNETAEAYAQGIINGEVKCPQLYAAYMLKAAAQKNAGKPEWQDSADEAMTVYRFAEKENPDLFYLNEYRATVLTMLGYDEDARQAHQAYEESVAKIEAGFQKKK